MCYLCTASCWQTPANNSGLLVSTTKVDKLQLMIKNDKHHFVIYGPIFYWLNIYMLE